MEDKSEDRPLKGCPTVNRPWLRRHTATLITFVIIIVLILGVRGCVGLARKSVTLKAPSVELPVTPNTQNGIPVYEMDIHVKFTSLVTFIEIVSDSVYQQEKSTFLRSLFPGRLLGGEVIYVNGVSEWKIEAGKYTGGTYWIRAASHMNTKIYKENLDRILYDLVGRIVDSICGYLPDRRGPGGLYGPAEFHSYAVGQFKGFRVSATK